MAKSSTQDKIKAWIKDYANTGWKVLLLQSLIFLAYLGMYALATYMFGDLTTPKINSFLEYLLFPIALIIIFTAYLVLNGIIARKVFKWR